MEMRWKNCCGAELSGQVPEEALPFVEAIGFERTATLFLTFGGAPVYVPAKSSTRSPLVKALGEDGLELLVEHFGSGHLRIPLACMFLARVLRQRGLSADAIARQLRRQSDTVRRYLNDPLYAGEATSAKRMRVKGQLKRTRSKLARVGGNVAGKAHLRVSGPEKGKSL